jgi:hypothetical protein
MKQYACARIGTLIPIKFVISGSHTLCVSVIVLVIELVRTSDTQSSLYTADDNHDAYDVVQL